MNGAWSAVAVIAGLLVSGAVVALVEWRYPRPKPIPPFFADDGTVNTPDLFAVGTARCPCGDFGISNLRGPHGATLSAQCPSCGRILEIGTD